MSTLLTKLTADFNTQLSTAISVGGTTATLLSQTDDDGVTLPDGVYVFTLDGSTSNKEYIRCTKTGTSLTSIQSLSRQGALTSGCVRAHRVGTSVIITDWAQLKYLTDLLSGTTDLDSSDPLKYDGTATLTSGSNQLATVIYAEGLANQGAANASTSVKGIAKLSTAAVDSNEPIVVGDNDTRMPTQGENDALVGTSGTPSSSNKYVTNDDTAENTASKLVRRKSDGNITVPTTPSAGADAVSKTYSDLNILVCKNGVSSRTVSTASGTQTIAHGLGKVPKKVFIRAEWLGTSSNQQNALAGPTVSSSGVYNGSTTATVYSTGAGSNGQPGSVGTDTTNIIKIVYIGLGGGGGTQSATITVDATNITLTWTLSGSFSGLGDLYFMWEALG